MVVRSAPFYVVVHVLTKQLNLSFISPQTIFQVTLWSVKVVFGKLHMSSNVLRRAAAFSFVSCHEILKVLHIVDS